MKNFFGEFKKFITKGNVIDLAVGVIMGTAFTAIVTALTKNIFQPLINWLLSLVGGSEALSGARLVLKGVYDETGKIIWDSSIYIDFGLLITAIIDFLLIAIILFLIVKTINKVRDGSSKLTAQSAMKRRAKKREKYAKMNAKRAEQGLEPIEVPAKYLEPVVEPEKEPEPDPQIVLLTEIRDLLSKKEQPKDKKEDK